MIEGEDNSKQLEQSNPILIEIASIAMRRSQLLSLISEILMDGERRDILLILLSKETNFLQSHNIDMPFWWCSAVHDLGVFYGMAKYGIFGWEDICVDSTLPLTKKAIKHYLTHSIRKEKQRRIDDDEKDDVKLPLFSRLERRMLCICHQVEKTYRASRGENAISTHTSLFSWLDDFRAGKDGSENETAEYEENNAFEDFIRGEIRRKEKALEDPISKIQHASEEEEIHSFEAFKKSMQMSHKRKYDIYISQIKTEIANGVEGDFNTEEEEEPISKKFQLYSNSSKTNKNLTNMSSMPIPRPTNAAINENATIPTPNNDLFFNSAMSERKEKRISIEMLVS